VEVKEEVADGMASFGSGSSNGKNGTAKHE